MKRVLGILLTVALSTLLAGCSIKFGVESRNTNNYTGKSINQSESIEGVDKINIDIEVSNVNISYYDGNNIEVFGTLGSSSRGVTINRNSNELVINEKSNKTINIGKSTVSELEVKIPSSYSGDLKLAFGVGECRINDVKADNMEVKAGVGQLKMNNISFNSLDLQSGLGEVDIETKEKTGNINIEGGVGDIYVKLGNIAGDLQFEGGMGNADISIPADSPVSIKTSSGLGECNVSAKTSGENKYIFDVSMGVGSLNITN